MRKQSRKIPMLILAIDSMIPDNRLLRPIKNKANFDFIRRIHKIGYGKDRTIYLFLYFFSITIM